MGIENIKNSLIESWLSKDQKKTLEMFDICESPIEEKLLLELVKEKESIENDTRSFLVSGENCSIELKPQSEAVCGSELYRLDIELSIKDKRTGSNHRFAIECDGHDFHEKTKEQVMADKERERNLMKYGYCVIRFSGSEIYHSANDCAFDVFYIAKKLIESYRSVFNEGRRTNV